MALIVDDNEDLVAFMKDSLSLYFRIQSASNGREAWQKISELMPDIIVSDVMMPEMDGNELCRWVKTDKRTSDIPMILLTARQAVARGIITMNEAAFAAVRDGTAQKGDVLGVARIAGIMAAKRTSELIPLCHPLPLSKLTVDFHLLPEQQAVEAVCTARTIGVTGVEMEALTGVSAALLTIYDMCKAVDKGMELGEIHLVEKTGGKSGHYVRAEGGYV